MTAHTLLKQLKAGGARLEKRENRLIIDAPRSLLGTFASDIQKFKPQILELLDATGDGEATFSPSPMPQQSPATGLSPSPDARAPNSAQNSASGPSRPILVFCDATARRRVMPELRRMLPDDDVLQIGRALLMLDAGEPIE